MSQCDQAKAYIAENIDAYAKKTNKKPGQYSTTTSLQEAVADAWLVIECVPEKLEMKTQLFGELTGLTRHDAILATNSSSYRSSEMLTKVPDECKPRVLNMHYYMPPSTMVVELMTCGHTDPPIIEHLVQKSRDVGTLPYVAKKESTGFIFNRLWAAVKRETLTILAEGVSTPEEIDSMWAEMFLKGGSLPCKTMDGKLLSAAQQDAHANVYPAVGLDTVAFIESHYVAERGLSPSMTVDYLKREYLESDKLGNKSPNGGLYPPSNEKRRSADSTSAPKILALDVGLSSSRSPSSAGEIVELCPNGQIKPIVENQALPDGLAIDSASQRMFWTCMGSIDHQDGAVYSANLDGSDTKTLVAPGVVHTPKQLTLDAANQLIYFCDREGLGVYRCKYNGSNLQQVVNNSKAGSDVLGWCVGIALAPSLSKIFWTQKGPSKGGKGRIFSAALPPPDDLDAVVTNVKSLLDNLPEPIDLEYDEESRTLYWTDRGELPHGNSLNRIQLDSKGDAHGSKKEILTKGFHEAIGLKLDMARKSVYVTDLGGSIYCYRLDDRTKSTLVAEEGRAFTGIACVEGQDRIAIGV